MTLLISGGFAVIVVTSLALIVRALLHKSQTVGWREMLAIYFYVVSIISLLAIVSGGAMTTKALLSDVFGRNFSYQNYYLTNPQPVVSIENGKPVDPKIVQQQQLEQNRQDLAERDRIEQAYQDDLLTGVSALIVGLLFLGVHVVGWRKMQARGERAESFWFGGYILLQLVLYGLTSLVALPWAISQSLRFVMVAAGPNVPVPGEAVGIALWSTPVWVVFVWLALRMSRRLPNTDLRA